MNRDALVKRSGVDKPACRLHGQILHLFSPIQTPAKRFWFQVTVEDAASTARHLEGRSKRLRDSEHQGPAIARCVGHDRSTEPPSPSDTLSRPPTPRTPS